MTYPINEDMLRNLRSVSTTEAAELARSLQRTEALPGTFDVSENRNGIRVARSDGNDLPFVCVTGEHDEQGTVTIFSSDARAYIYADQVRFIEA